MYRLHWAIFRIVAAPGLSLARRAEIHPSVTRPAKALRSSSRESPISSAKVRSLTSSSPGCSRRSTPQSRAGVGFQCAARSAASAETFILAVA
jgi:hypothetical protein